MYHQKIYCKYDKFDPTDVATILYNLSTNKYGFINCGGITIYLNKAHSILSCYNTLDTLNERIPITFSEEWLNVQIILNKLNEGAKSNIIIALKKYPTKMLLIISAILSFTVISDMKYMIISKLFTKFKLSIEYYIISNNKCAPFFRYFGGVCDYIVRFQQYGNIAKKLIDHFVTTKMDDTTNIMYVSNSCTLCMLHNKYCDAKFTFLHFDHGSNNCYFNLFDTQVIPESASICEKTFDHWFKIIDKCAIIFYCDVGISPGKCFNISDLIEEAKYGIIKIKHKYLTSL